MDNLNIQLDASELIKASNEAAMALTSLKAKFMELSNATPAGQLKAQVQGIMTEMTSAADAIGKVFGQIGAAAGKAQASARESGKKVGKATAEGLVEGLEIDAAAVAKQVAAAINQATSPFQRFSPVSGLKGRVVVPDSSEAARYEAEAARIRLALGRAFDPQEVSDTFRLLQGAIRNDSEAVLGLLSNFYRRLEADATRKDAAWKRVANPEQVSNSFRSLRSELHNDTALIQSELSRYYERLQADAARLDAAWKRIANPEQVSNSFRSLRSELHENSQLVQAELAKFYGGLQRVDQLKQTIRGRLAAGTSDSALAARPADSRGPTLDQRDAMYAQAMGSMKAYYTELEAASAKATKGAKGAIPDVERLGHVTRDAHSAARGLASGFNAIWLTWGAIGPLLAGAAVSNAFVQAIKRGAEFENTLYAIGYAAETGADDLDSLSEAALRMGREGPHGPLEVAKALKTLALAGLSAKEQLEAIKPVKNFAMAGEMGLDQAAESLVAISRAFGYDALGMSAVSDVIAKAAAVSMASIESMTDSFRQASTVAQMYGVSVEDAATSLALLSQMGIKGSAAGTATRNMYNELLGMSKEAKKILSDVLKVDVIDNASRAMKPLAQILADLSGALSKYDFKSQLEILQKLGNERGMKALAADLTAFVTAANGSGKDAVTVLQQLQQQLADAPGFAAMAAVGMAMSTKNQIKSVGSAIEAALVDAFNGINVEAQSTARFLRELFASEEFKSAVQSLTTAVADFTRFLIEHRTTLAAVASGYIIGKAALAGFAIAANAGAAAAATLGVSTTAASVGARALMASLGPIGALLAAAGTAYILFAEKSQTASGTAARAAEVHAKTVSEGIDKEIERLQAQIKARQEGTDASMLAARTEANLAHARMVQLHDEQRAVEQTRHAHLILQRARIADSEYGNTAQGAAATKQIDAKIDASRNRIADVVLSHTSTEAAFLEKQRRMFALAQQDAQEATAAAASRRQTPAGTTKFNSVSPPRDASGEASAAAALKDRALNLAKEARDIEFKMAEEAARHEEALLKDRYARGLLNYGEYENALLAMQQAASERRRATLQSEADALSAAAAAIQSDLDKAAAAGAKNVDQKKANELQERLNALGQLRLEIQRLDNQAIERSAEARTRALAPALNLVKTAERESETQRLNVEQEIEKLRLKASGTQLSEKEVFVQGEVLRITNAQADTVKKLETSYKQMVDEGRFADLSNPAVLKAWLEVQTTIAKARADLEASTGIARVAADKVFDAKRVDDMAKSLKTSLADAILDAGEDGGEGLRKALEEELLRKPFRMVIEAMLEPVTKQLAGSFYDFAKQILPGFFGATGSSSSSSSSGAGVISDLIPAIIDGFASADGGGYTGGGSRSGGLDGRGGFLAMLHPQESVVDHYRGQRGPSAAASQKVDVTVNNYSGVQATTEEVVDSRGNRRIEVTIGDLVSGEMRRAGSSSHQSIRQAFGARPALARR